MKPSPALLFPNRKWLLIVTALLIFSAIFSTASVTRSGGLSFSFYTQHQQEQAPIANATGANNNTSSASATASSPYSPPTPSQTQHHNDSQKKPNEYKYFYEAGFTPELMHYDVRFFKAPIPYYTHRAVLKQLIRSYLTTFQALRLETWLAHGTLLGWWWNARIMPWDYDVDVQVSGETMGILAARYNGSMHEYTHYNETSREEETRWYLLDVNPFALQIDRGEGHNAIDARWIDVDTGLYVDITALMEREPKNRPGIVSCKNFHQYEIRELYPLRETKFEGVEAMVPWRFEKLLVDEYGEKSLVTTEWEGHHWDADAKEWVKDAETNKTANKTEIEGAS